MNFNIKSYSNEVPPINDFYIKEDDKILDIIKEKQEICEKYIDLIKKDEIKLPFKIGEKIKLPEL